MNDINRKADERHKKEKDGREEEEKEALLTASPVAWGTLS